MQICAMLSWSFFDLQKTIGSGPRLQDTPEFFFNMFSSWWPVKLDNKLGGHGPWAGPEKEESRVHESLGLRPSLGHQTYISSSPWTWAWGTVWAGRTKWRVGVESVSVRFISQEAAERRGCLLPLPRGGSLFLLFFSPRSSLPFKVTGSYPGEREQTWAILLNCGLSSISTTEKTALSLRFSPPKLRSLSEGS